MRTGLCLAAIVENRENATVFLPIQSSGALSCEGRASTGTKTEHACWSQEGSRSGLDTVETSWSRAQRASWRVVSEALRVSAVRALPEFNKAYLEIPTRGEAASD